GEHSKTIGDFQETIRPLENFRFRHPLTLNAAQAFNFRLSGFLDADVAYAARCRSQEQREIRGARAFGKAEMLRKLPPRIALRHEIQQERRPTAAVAIFEIDGEIDGQGAMITDRSSSRKLSR